MSAGLHGRSAPGRRAGDGVIASATAMAMVMLCAPLAAAEPAVDVQTRCFRDSGQHDALLQLRLVALADGNEAAFVRHRGAQAWLPLVLSRRNEAAMADSGRSAVETQWVEMAHDRITGRYALGMMGNDVLSFDRVDSGSGRRTSFEIAPTPRGVDPCETR